MDNLPFCLWVLLFPMCANISDLILAKKREITHEPHTKDSNKVAVLCLIIWVGVAILLYH